jgi:hypothetical protein
VAPSSSRAFPSPAGSRARAPPRPRARARDPCTTAARNSGRVSARSSSRHRCARGPSMPPACSDMEPPRGRSRPSATYIRSRSCSAIECPRRSAAGRRRSHDEQGGSGDEKGHPGARGRAGRGRRRGELGVRGRDHGQWQANGRTGEREFGVQLLRARRPGRRRLRACAELGPALQGTARVPRVDRSRPLDALQRAPEPTEVRVDGDREEVARAEPPPRLYDTEFGGATRPAE